MEETGTGGKTLYVPVRLMEHRDVLEAIESGRGTSCAPLHLRIETTEACNFKCDFCPWHGVDRHDDYPNADFGKKRQLGIDQVLALIDESWDMGTRAYSFTGAGDPLVYPAMDRVLARILERGGVFGMTSNLAMKLSDALVDLLARARWMRWSMNAGSAEVYLRTNNPVDGARAWERVQQNVSRVVEARKRLGTTLSLNASMIVSTVNEKDCYPAAQLAKSLGVDSVNFRPDTPATRADVALRYSDLAWADIRRARSELESETFRVQENEGRLEDVSKVNDPELVCYYSNHETYIASNGDVYPCCYTRSDRQYVMGNIKDGSFAEFWASPARRENYKKLQFDKCPSCPYGGTNKLLQKLYTGEKKADDLHREAGSPNPFV